MQSCCSWNRITLAAKAVAHPALCWSSADAVAPSVDACSAWTPMPGDAEEVSLLSAAALSSLMQSDACPPLVLEAVMGHSSSGHAFIPGAVLA